MKSRFYEFGPFQIDKLNHVLLRDGDRIPLKPKVFDTLLLLVENRERVLDKDELLRRLWPDTVVEESNLSQNVYLLRKVLGEEAGREIYIATMPKRGYRFVASVKEVENAVQSHSPRLQVHAAAEKNGSYAVNIQQPIRADAQSVQSNFAPSSLRVVALAIVSFVLVLAVVLALYFRSTNKSSPRSGAPINTVAVLPFKPAGQTNTDEDLGFGMADTLITRLNSLKQIKVRPMSSTRKFASPNQDSIAAGRELKVDAVLEANIQRAGDRVRVTMRLIDVRDGSVPWSGVFDEQVNANPFALQDRVAEQVAQALIPQLTGEQKNLVTKHSTANPEAYRLYMLGRYHANKNGVEDWKQAIEYFNAAIERDPGYALAYTGLANTYLSLVADSMIAKAEAIPKAKEAATTALRLDDNLAEAHISSGRIYMYYDWDWSAAEREFKRAIELNPNSGDAHREYAAYFTNGGQSDQAVAEAKLGRDLDPLTRVTNFQFAWALISAHRYDEALQHAQEVLAMFPEAHFWIGLADLGKGKYGEAAGEFEKKLSLSKDSDPLTSAHLSYAYAMMGKHDAAVKILAELTALYEQRQASPYHLAIVYAGLGDKDQTFARLNESYREHSRPLVSGLKVNPTWDRLRSDSRFKDLLRRMGLPQ